MTEGWQKATLAERIPDQAQERGPGPIRRILGNEARGLRVEWGFSTRRNWLQIQAKGEDAEAFLNLYRNKFGEAPVQHSRLEKWDLLRGFVTGAGRVGFGVYIDLGVLEPSPKDSLYPLHRMRAQLADGQTKSCREILEENAIVDSFPVKVVVTDIEGEKITVELADETREIFLSWRKFPFDRVITVGAEREAVNDAIVSANLQHDIIRVESLSLFTHSLLCKIGTEAPGVISKVGDLLKGVAMSAYRAKLRY